MGYGSVVWREGVRWFAAVAGENGVLWLGWSRDKAQLERKIEKYAASTGTLAERALLEQVRREVGEYLAGARREFTVSIAPEGTGFERKVWERLRKVPFGESISYGELAREIGSPGAARAVGRAAGRNPIPIIIPCHRLLAARRKLGGFSGGLEEKKWLLQHEGIVYRE